MVVITKGQSAGKSEALGRFLDAHRAQLAEATLVPRALLGRDRFTPADIAALDAVEGRTEFVRTQRARGA